MSRGVRLSRRVRSSYQLDIELVWMRSKSGRRQAREDGCRQKFD
jgi:hypothetical protein